MAVYGKGHTMKIDIGLSEESRKKIAEGLSGVLADSYTLYLKTHNFHWNVTGPHFNALHLMFEKQYMELAEAVDALAERIRALGFRAPASYKEYAKLTTIIENDHDLSANEMIKELVIGNECIIKSARKVFPEVDGANDEATADLLTKRMEIHEKAAWMLRSLLEN